MMKNIVLSILNEYLMIFPEEKEKQSKLLEYLNMFDDKKIIDWNNFDGHIVASGFIYSKKDKKFLVMYHNDMKMYIYPGGHIDINDKNPKEAAIREVKEETGLSDFKEINISKNSLVPIDIDTHIIDYNERLDLPKHYHFDFRYLFIIEDIDDINIDNEELSSFKWIDINELSNDLNYGNIVNKINKII